MKWLTLLSVFLCLNAKAADLTLEGDEAASIIAAFTNLGEGELSLSLPISGFYIGCDREAVRCFVSFREELGVSLYRNDEAARLYRALTLKEIEGRYGFAKTLVTDRFAIRCDRFGSSLGMAYSCSIEAAKE